MIEIEDYVELPPGKVTIATFSVYLPGAKLRIRSLRLMRLKNSFLKVGMPSYSPKTSETFLGQDKQVWKAYVEFSPEKQKDFETAVIKALEPFVRGVP